MANKSPINVLVYTGEGTSAASVAHTLSTLRSLLSPRYVVAGISSTQLLNEPWPAACAALVMPGGADLPYCRLLNGRGNDRIRQFVADRAGRYLGFCAGAYYASAECEFMKGSAKMEVVGSRELAFFPGVGRGLAFAGFEYASEKGARAVKLAVEPDAFLDLEERNVISYYNGGGVFVDASTLKDKGVQVLASYDDDIECDGGHGKAAVIYCKVGQGAALLTGPHPEFLSISGNLDPTADISQQQILREELNKTEIARAKFMKACLNKLGLETNPSSEGTLTISPIHLASREEDMMLAILLSKWAPKLVQTTDNQLLLTAEANDFIITNPPTVLLNAVKPSSNPVDISELAISSNITKDPRPPPIKLIVHPKIAPLPRETSPLSMPTFFSALPVSSSSSSIGTTLLYASLTTSTSTLLESNPTLHTLLPAGSTFAAGRQLAARGRGNNAWLSPPGSLACSVQLTHPAALGAAAPVVFVQYLAGMAVVRAVRALQAHPNTRGGRGAFVARARGEEDGPVRVRLKWPNDVYAWVPMEGGDAACSGGEGGNSGDGSYLKVGGVLVTSSYSGSAYQLVVGIGVNVANAAAPTTSLDYLATICKSSVKSFAMESLLASILGALEELYSYFKQCGWDARLEEEYYSMWLHSGQDVIVESEGGLKVKIEGITRDWGLLIGEELNWEGKRTGRKVTLQSDNNSFDFMRGLIKRKA